MSEQKTAGAKTDEVLLGVPVNQLPELPWTFAALGHEKYYALATYGNYFTGQEVASYTPDLDPRSFARGVAWRLISSAARIDARTPLAQRSQIITDILDGKLSGGQLAAYFPEEFIPQVQTILQEAAKLSELINQMVGKTMFTPRNAEADKFAEALKSKQR